MKQTRLKLVIGKFPVKRVIKTPTGYEFSVELPGLGLLAFNLPKTADIHEGDLLTFYTEILTKGAPNAQSSGTS